jgi:hypothetical protein
MTCCDFISIVKHTQNQSINQSMFQVGMNRITKLKLQNIFHRSSIGLYNYMKLNFLLKIKHNRDFTKEKPSSLG